MSTLVVIRIAAVFSTGLAALLSAPGFSQSSPEEFVCHNGVGECDAIALQGQLPDPSRMKPNDVVHLYNGAKFSISYDGKTYFLNFRSTNWLASFPLANPLTWQEGEEWADEDVCEAFNQDKLQELRAPQPQVTKKAKLKYARFESKLIPVHLTSDFLSPDYHMLFIYPMEPDAKDPKSHSYCVMVEPLKDDGGSHNGAVHGEDQ